MLIRSKSPAWKAGWVSAALGCAACSGSGDATASSAISSVYGDGDGGGDGDGSGGGHRDAGVRADGGAGASTVYRATTLVSDQAGKAPTQDDNLINPWGIASGPDTFFWVANNGTGTSTVYDGDGHPSPAGNPLIVTLPVPRGSSDSTAAPTGVVFTGNAAFQLRSGNQRGDAQFVFATEQGTLIGWNPMVASGQGVIALDESGSNAVFKAIALARNGQDNQLFVTNFHDATVEVFDEHFARVELGNDAFRDPNLPRGYAPFGIQTIAGRLYVSYAQQDDQLEDDVPGKGKGFVSAFRPDGSFVARVASQGDLNAPWALTVAPKSFGQFGGALLVGNFGDGHINAFDLKSHTFLGQLSGQNGKPIAIDGLWALVFGNGRSAGTSGTLYFSAGPDGEANGAFGRIEAQ